MTVPPWLSLLIIGIGTATVPLDTTVNLAFPHIVAAFGIEVADIKWVVICYVGVHASLMLTCGRLGDVFGHRKIFLIGCLWSAGAFVACTLAPDFTWLLVARLLQGAGAAMVMSVGPALATASYPPAARSWVLGLYTMVFGLGAVIGPPLAGVLVARWGWSAVYAFRIPLAVLGFTLAWLLPVDAVAPVASARRGIGASVMALRHPLVEAVVVNVAGFSALFLGPFLLVRIGLTSPQWSGLVLAMSPLGMVIAAPAAGWLTARLGGERLIHAGLLIAAAGLAMMGIESFGLAGLMLGMLLLGVGQGAFQVANTDQVVAALPPEDRGVAGSLALITRTIGLMIGANVLMSLTQAIGGGNTPEAGVRGTYLVAGLGVLVLWGIRARKGFFF